MPDVFEHVEAKQSLRLTPQLFESEAQARFECAVRALPYPWFTEAAGPRSTIPDVATDEKTFAGRTKLEPRFVGIGR